MPGLAGACGCAGDHPRSDPRQLSPRPAPRPLVAAVFDCDGLLLDTEPLWTVGEEALFRRYGRVFGPDDKRALLGTAGAAAGRVLARLLERPGRETPLVEELLDLCAEGMSQAQPMPGAREVLARIGDRLPLAAASNSPRRLLAPALHASGVEAAFRVVLSVEDVVEPKPAPDLYLAACERLGVSPTQAIALEDSPTGVASARAAGLYVIGIPSYPGVRLEADLVASRLDAPEVLGALGCDP